MLKYILLGVLQGIFEWLPISSEGVVALFSNFIQIKVNPIDMALFLHLGTMLAVLIYFYKDWKRILLFKDINLVKFLIYTTIISLIIGYPLYTFVRELAIGVSLLFLVGIGLLLTAYFNKSKKTFNLSLENNILSLSIICGVLQGLAVIPGLSRSGSTIFGLSLGKFKPEEILKLSYLMSLPVTLVATIFVLINDTVLLETWPALIMSFIVGLLTLSLLMRLSKRINFFYFALIFAILCFIGGIVGLII